MTSRGSPFTSLPASWVKAGEDEVLVSRTVRDLTAGSGLRFEDRGTHTLKGIPEDWQLYALA